MSTSAWSTQQLAEFVVAVSAAETESSAAIAVVERAAEALDADVAAIVCGHELVAAIGYPQGTAPVDVLEAVTPGLAGCSLDVPGVGACVAAAASLEHPPGATLVLARPAPHGLTREETALLRAMARVASITMRMLRVLDNERAARDELERLARDHAALRRVATLIARGVAPNLVVAAVAEEAGQVLPAADLAMVGRYVADSAVEIVGAWSSTGDDTLVGRHAELGGRNVVTLVHQSDLPARTDTSPNGPRAVTALGREIRTRSVVGAPINVEGRLWGVMIVASGQEDSLPESAERRLAEFTELVATAIANAEAKTELTASRARIVTSADETRRRLSRDLHDGAQQWLVTLAVRLRAVQTVVPSDLDELAAELDSVVSGLNSALDELREFARGIHPAILAQGGLGPALTTLAGRATVPVDLEVRTEGRLPEPVEVAAYYVVSEALANAAKHANAAKVTVEVTADDDLLLIRVSDDGVGGADFARGSGLVGLRDRVEALGGHFALRSSLGVGTALSVELALR